MRNEGAAAGCKGGHAGSTTGHAGNTVALEDSKHKKHIDTDSSALFHLFSLPRHTSPIKMKTGVRVIRKLVYIVYILLLARFFFFHLANS